MLLAVILVTIDVITSYKYTLSGVFVEQNFIYNYLISNGFNISTSFAVLYLVAMLFWFGVYKFNKLIYYVSIIVTYCIVFFNNFILNGVFFNG